MRPNDLEPDSTDGFPRKSEDKMQTAPILLIDMVIVLNAPEFWQ